ncbi:MAG: hypothetical protein AAFY04_06125, partial [Pseudomonadota bacterium]
MTQIRKFGLARPPHWLKRGAAVLAMAVVVATAAVPRHAAAETLAQTLADAYEHSGLLDQNRALLR